MPALATCRFIEFLLGYYFNKLHFYLYKFLPYGMDNSSNSVQELLVVSNFFAVSGILVAMFNSCVIKTVPSNAELSE